MDNNRCDISLLAWFRVQQNKVLFGDLSVRFWGRRTLRVCGGGEYFIFFLEKVKKCVYR